MFFRYLDILFEAHRKDEFMKSVLLGNGININFGGKAYSNRFIINRIIFNAKANKYDALFNNSLSGEDIVIVFDGFKDIAKKIIDGKYDSLENKDVADAIKSFQGRYKDRSISKVYDIMLEDWFFLIKMFFIENSDLSIQWQAAKQGFEQLILDGIYNDGMLNTLNKNMNKKVKHFFSEFDNIFTLNYDNNIDKLVNREVLHLHGDYSVLPDSENPDTLIGALRNEKGENIIIFESQDHAPSIEIYSKITKIQNLCSEV